MNEKHTPETDAAAEEVGMGHFMVDADHARNLERERDEAREALSEIALYLSVGMGDETTTAQQYKKRILDGIKMLTEPIVNLWKQAEKERDEAREALVRASLYIVEVTGSCPYDFFDIEPHDYPCSEVCDKYTNDMHLCWKKHFTNKKETK